MQREDLNLIEEAEELQDHKTEFKYIKEELSNILGKSRLKLQNN